MEFVGPANTREKPLDSLAAHFFEGLADGREAGRVEAGDADVVEAYDRNGGLYAKCATLSSSA